MARSVGVTVSAVVVFIGSAFTILCGAMALLGSVLVKNSERMPNLPGHLGYIVLAEAVYLFGLGGWGIASGVGVIGTREWARISMQVFAALLILVILPAALVMAFIRFPVPNDPNLPPNFMVMMRVFLALFYGIFAALGGFWLYFFNTRSVKAQFQAAQRAVAGAADLSVGAPDARLSASPHARPISITIIAWFLVISSALGALFFPYFRAFFPGVPMPLCFLGFFLQGRSAVLVYSMWAAAQMVFAMGLLKLRNWGRLGTIGLQGLGIANAALLFGVPANRAKFQQIMDTMNASMGVQMPRPAPFVFPAWLGIVSSLPIFIVILWFLVAKKQAFTSSGQQPAGEL